MREFLIFCAFIICTAILIVFAFSIGEQRECKRWSVYGNDTPNRPFLLWQKLQCGYYNIELENPNANTK